MESGTARLLIEFPTPSAYLSFTSAYPDEESPIQLKSLDIVPVPEGIAKGYLKDTSLTTTGDTPKPITYEEAAKKDKFYIAAVEGPALIQTDGAVQYVSEDVTIEGNMVRTPEDGVSYIIFK